MFFFILLASKACEKTNKIKSFTGIRSYKKKHFAAFACSL